MEDFDRIATYLDAFVEQEQRIDIHDCPRELPKHMLATWPHSPRSRQCCMPIRISLPARKRLLWG
jgi:hypothetical protein